MISLNQLQNSGNICIFIRHGEKNLDGYDLSSEGKKQSLEFAEKLYLLNKEINVFSSPEQRCIETATIINNRVNGESSNISLSSALGKPGIQVKNEIEYAKLTDTMRCRDIFSEWKRGKCCEAMHRPEIVKERVISFFEKTSFKNDGITLYISQSGTVACTGYALNLTDYKNVDHEWVDYLDGYIFRL